ncbi:MAG: protein kinase [Planctomycetes bacterium]|nr:protein kinase [Planctomycetota bacterium]
MSPLGRDDPRANETSWDTASQLTLEAVVERGWLDPDAARAALDAYRDQGSEVSFASYLLERGLLSASQVATLEQARPGSSPRREIAPGAVFSGCRIERKLGEGGMGSVYLATRHDGSPVVVKFLAATHARDPAWRARFLREATLARKIDHPNVVKVFALEVEGEQPHIVMECVNGADLEERLTHGPLPAPEVARIGRDVALGLAAAHAQGVIHRDVKPGNVRLTEEGEVKILDFGLAKAVQTDDGVSLAGQVLGTPWYMAPEQWGDHMVDPRTDVFALGATLYHLVTGAPPFQGKKPLTICRLAAAGKCARPSALVPGLPPALELAILRMLSVDRRARYGSAEECAAALQAALDGAPVRVPGLTHLGTGELYPLVPPAVHVLGRGEEADVPLADPAASRTHARIRLGVTGYQLVDLESTYGTWVNGVRVDDVLLKAGDVIRCGQLELRFDDGGVGATPPRSASAHLRDRGRLQVATLPEPFLDHLVEVEDKRTVIALLERLPLESIEARVDSSLSFLRARFDDDLALRAGTALRAKLLARQREAARHLFRITFENLGGDCAAWLTWWGEHHATYPPQLGPQRLRPRVRLRLAATGDAPPRVLELTERLRTTIGRGDDNDVRLPDPSISRRHATILRLHQRLMIRDDGSRFGTKLGARRVPSAFLGDGDRVTLGQVTLECEVEDLVANPPQTPQGLYLVDPKLFGVLCDLRHPSVAAALFAFLRVGGQLDWIDRQAARLFDERAAVRTCADAVRAAYLRNAARATELLPTLVPALAGVPPGDAGAAWHDALTAAALGPQLLPVGWFQPSA